MLKNFPEIEIVGEAITGRQAVDRARSLRPDVILMAITGHLSSFPRIGEMVLAEWKKAGLLRASTVKPIVTSLEKDLVIRRLGSLEPKDAQALRNSFQVIFG